MKQEMNIEQALARITELEAENDMRSDVIAVLQRKRDYALDTLDNLIKSCKEIKDNIL